MSVTSSIKGPFAARTAAPTLSALDVCAAVGATQATPFQAATNE